MSTERKPATSVGETRHTRRDLLGLVPGGVLGAAALAELLSRDSAHATPVPGESADPCPHHSPKAKRAIQIFLCGGMSHIDTFDYKPELIKNHGKPLGGSERPDVFFGQVGLLHQPFFPFRQRGASGLWISDLFPNLGGLADELCVIRSMVAETSNHTPATFQANTGFRLNGFPTMGAWLSYGLGSESDDLPTYVVLPDARGVPAGGSINWSSGFLPAHHQGVPLRSRGEPLQDLFPARPISEETETASRGLLADLNRRHMQSRAANELLDARQRSYELAARMQLAMPKVAELGAETAATHSLYGLDRPESADFGRACLLGRRLLEQGVRFVQLFSGSSFGSPRINWDGHEDVVQNHSQEAVRVDRPVAGLITDLKERGMLADTLVLLTTEFGRTPFTQSADGVLGKGRDHNQYGFSICLAGAGVKRGFAYGATDEIGWKAVDNRTDWHDLHASVLHLLGIDHERLTFYHNGIRRRLTNVHGRVITELFA